MECFTTEHKTHTPTNLFLHIQLYEQKHVFAYMVQKIIRFLIDSGFLQLCQRMYKEEILQNLFQHEIHAQDRTMYILLPHMFMLYFNTCQPDHETLTFRILDMCSSLSFPSVQLYLPIVQSTEIAEVLTTHPIIWNQLWCHRNCDKNLLLFLSYNGTYALTFNFIHITNSYSLRFIMIKVRLSSHMPKRHMGCRSIARKG